MKIGNREFFPDLKHTYIMGILNITPDSFFDGGLYRSKDAILKRIEEMIKEGADVIDIGGESTRPGYEMISAEEEINRVTDVIDSIKKRFEIPLSLDTYKAAVAKAGIEAGADMINDIWGLKYDPKIAAVISKGKVACCLTHNREKKLYHDLISDINSDLQDSLKIARAAGIATEKIILDPGIGFAKDYEHNLTVLARLSAFNVHGLPCLLGASRKSVIGFALDLPVGERLEGTMVTTVMAVLSGYLFVRVHDIAANRRSIQMTEAIQKNSKAAKEAT